MHTLVIGAAAVEAHLAHGDKLGACQGESALEVAATDCGGSNDHGNDGNPDDGGTGTGEGGTGIGEGRNDSGGSDGGSVPDSTLNY
jgi:hypothetical protein